MADEKSLSLVAHLEELRNRIIKSLICVIFFFCASCPFVGKIFSLVVKPVGKLVFLAPQEAFIANLKVAFFAGLFLALPFILFQVWRFISTGLNEKEKRYIGIFGPLSFIFFLAGAVFCYIVILPISMRFFLGFATDYMIPMISVSEYISFVGSLTISFGLVFELPLVILFLAKVGIVSPQLLKRKRRHAIVIIFVIAAALTPPDVVSQCLMAIPLLALYELGILFSKIGYKQVCV